jgi:beta-lactamase superfamily II metal-dependent hydrolase
MRGRRGDTSTTESFLAAVRPTIAVYSAGLDNPFGHPHPSVIDRVRQAGTTVYGTAEDGTIVITSDGTSLDVRTQRAER